MTWLISYPLADYPAQENTKHLFRNFNPLIRATPQVARTHGGRAFEMQQRLWQRDTQRAHNGGGKALSRLLKNSVYTPDRLLSSNIHAHTRTQSLLRRILHGGRRGGGHRQHQWAHCRAASTFKSSQTIATVVITTATKNFFSSFFSITKCVYCIVSSHCDERGCTADHSLRPCGYRLPISQKKILN